MPTGLLEEFVRVSRGFPCPVCGKPDWCLVARDGLSAICQRIESPNIWDGKRGSRVGYLHSFTEPIEVPQTASQAKPKLPASDVAELVDYWYRFEGRDQQVRKLAGELGVDAWSLDALVVGWRGDCFAFPMRDGDWNFVGVRFRGDAGRKWSLSGGREGIFGPCLKRAGQVFVTEGASDCAAVLSIGLSAIGRPNRCAAWDHVEAALKKSRAEDVVLISDADPDGRRDTKQLQEILAKQFPRVRSIVPTNHKDAREVLADGQIGRAELLAALDTDNEFWSRL